MANVLLLRSPCSIMPDRYEIVFRARGYHPVSVPILETTYMNLQLLRDIILDGPGKRSYDGVVITSARSSEAWKTVVLRLVEDDPDVEEDESANWAFVPFYVVGEATSKALCDIREIVGEYAFAPRDIRGAAESGTSERLAHFILKDLAAKAQGARLLYLTGDKNRDTLPKILSDGGVALDAIQVYETRGSSTFEEDLRKALHEVPLDTAPSPHTPHPVESPLHPPLLGSNKWWITYFAPSDAECATPILREHFTLTSTEPEPEATSPPHTPTPRIAAIGSTTGSFLRANLALQVDVVSPRPNADALAEAIAAFDAAHPTD